MDKNMKLLLQQPPHGVEKVVDPSNFLPFGIKHQKKKKKKDQHSLLILLDRVPINIITSSSPATSCSSLGVAIIIILVVKVNTGMTLSVSGGSEVARTSHALSLSVLSKGLLPACVTSLLLLLIIVII